MHCVMETLELWLFRTTSLQQANPGANVGVGQHKALSLDLRGIQAGQPTNSPALLFSGLAHPQSLQAGPALSCCPGSLSGATVQQTGGRADSATLTLSELAHLQPGIQGQLCSAAQARCWVCSLKCCNSLGAGPSYLDWMTSASALLFAVGGKG